MHIRPQKIIFSNQSLIRLISYKYKIDEKCQQNVDKQKSNP